MLSVSRIFFAAFGILWLSAWPASALEEPDVDVELCLAADGSGSITEEEFAFQRQGFAAAITDARVLDAIRRGLYGKIALAHMEWGGAESMHKIVGWHVIAKAEDARAFADELLAAPRLATGWNSISNAIVFCHAWMTDNEPVGLRRVIDVSGDAGQRGGVPLFIARQAAEEDGVIINALALNFRGGGLSGPGGQPLLTHFKRDVIAGPGAFALGVEERDAFVEALVRKLVLEIAGNSKPLLQAAEGNGRAAMRK